MIDYVLLGAVPWSESCAQLGDGNYTEQSRKEMKAFIHQLRRVFGPEPTGARLTIKSFPHGFGTYHEVVVIYNDEMQEAVDYAYKLEDDTPETWDEQARTELGL